MYVYGIAGPGINPPHVDALLVTSEKVLRICETDLRVSRLASFLAIKTTNRGLRDIPATFWSDVTKISWKRYESTHSTAIFATGLYLGSPDATEPGQHPG